MAQAAEVTRAKVQKRQRKASPPPARKTYDLPKLTKKPQPPVNLPKLTQKPQGKTTDTSKLPRLTAKPQPPANLPKLTQKPQGKTIDTAHMSRLTAKPAIDTSKLARLTPKPTMDTSKLPRLTPKPTIDTSKYARLTPKPTMDTSKLPRLTPKPTIDTSKFSSLTMKPRGQQKIALGDTKSNADRARATKYKATPQYRQTLRNVYDTKAVRHVTRQYSAPQYDIGSGGPLRRDANRNLKVTFGVKTKRPLAERQALLAAKASPVLAHLHKSRSDRNRQLAHDIALHDITTNADRARGTQELTKIMGSREYLAALSKSAFADAKRAGKTDSQAADAASSALDQAKANALHGERKQLKADAAGSALEAAVSPLRHKLSSSALWTAEQLTRPVYGIAGAADAATGKTRGNVLKAAGRGFALKDKKLFSDVLKDAGAPNWLAATAGFGLDVALDPTTYITLGTGVPAEVAAKGAYRAALRAGTAQVAAGHLTQHELERAALKTARDVYDAGRKHRGLTVGARGLPVKALTGGRTREVMHQGVVTRGTARVSGAAKATGKLVTPQGGRLAKAADRLGQSVVHDYRPRSIHPVDWNYMRDAARKYRAERSAADRLGTDRARMLHKALKKVDDPERVAIIHALEANDLTGLSAHAAKVARVIRQDLESQYHKEVEHGLLKHWSQLGYSSAPAYFPRYLHEHVFPHAADGTVNPTSSRRINANFLKGRKRQDALKDLTPEQLAEYDLRIPEAVGRRLQAGERSVALKNLHNRMAALGTNVTKNDLRHADAIRKGRAAPVHPNHVATRLAVVSRDPNARLLVKDDHGWKATQNKRGHIDLKKARGALKAGHKLVLVDPHHHSALEELANRGLNAYERPLSGHAMTAGASALGRDFDALQGRVKTLQTVVNPGYHLTNLVGDTFNARVGGATVSDFVRGFRLKRVEGKLDKSYRRLDMTPGHIAALGGKKRRYGDLHLDDGELVQLALQHGAIKSGFGGHELHQLVKESVSAPHPGRRFMNGLRSLSEKREDLTRLASFHSALKRGMSPDEAANWVNKHHFDYADLTDTERAVLRRLIPFYTFFARNTRLQATGLVTRPGVYANAEKARQESTRAGGFAPDFASTLRDFEQQGVPWGTPLKGLLGGKSPIMLFPKLPLTDLNNISGSPGQIAKNLLSRASPMLKVVIEQSTGKNTFTQTDYKTRVPAPAIFKVKGVRDFFNAAIETATGHKSAVKDIYDKTTGQMVPGWSWRFDEVARQIPQTSQAVNMTVPSRYDRPESAKLAAIGYALGPRPQAYDPRAVSLNQLWARDDKLTKQITDLKQTVAHKPGSKWSGKIARLSAEERNVQRKIYQQAKAMGAPNPPGIAPKKARKKSYGLGGSLGGGLGSKSQKIGGGGLGG